MKLVATVVAFLILGVNLGALAATGEAALVRLRAATTVRVVVT